MVSLWLSGYLPLSLLLNAALKAYCAFGFRQPVTLIPNQKSSPSGVSLLLNLYWEIIDEFQQKGADSMLGISTCPASVTYNDAFLILTILQLANYRPTEAFSVKLNGFHLSDYHWEELRQILGPGVNEVCYKDTFYSRTSTSCFECDRPSPIA